MALTKFRRINFLPHRREYRENAPEEFVSAYNQSAVCKSLSRLSVDVHAMLSMVLVVTTVVFVRA